jgi:2-desacetyl-2-hydroxyethyl bacteriochlorophyllide A dehydrogenase
MNAIVFHQPKEIRIIDIPRPEKPGPGEAIVRVHRVGVCGTDLSGYQGKMPLMTYPRIWGHELGVEVVEVAPDVSGVKSGDRCSVEPYINDPDSYASRRGHPNCCERLRVLGVHIDGGMRPFFAVPARKLHISRSLSFEQLALVETLAIGCHAAARGNPLSDESCMIIGAGPIGLATLEFVKLTGCKVIVLDISDQRLEFVRRHYPVQHTVKPSDKLEQVLRELTDGHLPDVVIDATGNAGSMSAAFGHVAPGGRLVYVGITSEEVKFRHAAFHRPEGTLLCSRNALPADFPRIIELIETGKINTAPWITHRCPFEQTAEVFPSFVRPETGVLKAVIEINNS